MKRNKDNNMQEYTQQCLDIIHESDSDWQWDGTAAGLAAKVFDTNKPYVHFAKHIKQNYPELYNALKAGVISIADAKRILNGVDSKAKVYFLHAVGTNFIKIGNALDVGFRLQYLQTGCPHKLELIATCTKHNEGYYHKKYHANRTQGEWFEFTNESINNIKKGNV